MIRNCIYLFTIFAASINVNFLLKTLMIHTKVYQNQIFIELPILEIKTGMYICQNLSGI